MKVSVCMGIYNGEKFIEKQLQTIYKQSRPADEVILCDDCSKDKSVEIVRKFISANKLEETWKLYQNIENKGYPGNFYYAMSLCTGDVVFLADQDDVWVENKISNMMRIMETHPHVELLASRWGIMDAEDNVLKEISRGHMPQKEEHRDITIEGILYCNDWPGMCSCYRKELGHRVIERVGESKIPHDIALGMLAAEKGNFWCVSQINQYHRRHDANVAMEEHRARKLLNKKRKLLEIEIYLKWLEELVTSKLFEKEESRITITNKQQIMKERLNNLQNGYRTRIIKQYLGNRKDIRLSTAVCDFIICCRQDKE
ncbi:MAG: glycosyltransferase [Lachnospiraceae bacterium]|nr:glycosyltransferase [Lachnospiraceae bacterium]